jgi:acetylornithine/N-succinyldiaminopimelate aminotransferase
MTVLDTVDLAARRAAAIMGNYAPPALHLVRGEGTKVWDADSNEYLDLLGGIAVSGLGHGHPAVVEAVTRQIGLLAHTSNLYGNLPSLQLAEKLIELLDLGETPARVFFCNSGTEANEAALKITRRTGRTGIIAAEGAFHGRTIGALSITGQPAKRAPFLPLLPDVTFVPFGDVAALQAAFTPNTAAVFLEPIMGEAGVIVPPDGYLAAARDLCDNTGALLVVDEIQSGIGRTGSWFSSRAQGVRPDVITLAKGLAGGLPIGACIGIGEAASLLQPGDHGSTFGGNPVACAGALAVLNTIDTEGLLEQVTSVGKQLAAGIASVDGPLLTGVRGRGLWLALELDGPVSGQVEAAARAAGFLVNAVAPDAIRLAPPLILTAAEADSFVAALPSILTTAAGVN